MINKKAIEYFKEVGLEARIYEFDDSSATVELAAERLGCEPNRIAKTLAFLVDNYPILIVTAGDAKVDNAKYRAKFNTKASMIPRENVEELIGYGVGGVCPFEVNEGVQIYLDESLKRFEHIYPACGASNNAIKLTIEELEQYSKYIEWIDVCKGWNEYT